MADLLAIISSGRHEPPGATDIEGLLGDYRRLRGEPTQRQDIAVGRCVATVVGHLTTPVAGVEREGGRWAAWAGPRAPGPALASPSEIGGQFALVRDAGDGEVVVATDRLGLKPLFVAEAGGHLFVSTSALVLARHLRLRPSEEGVRFFLRTGNQFGRLTPWQGLRRLLPAEALRIGDGGTTSETYWQPTIDPTLRELDFEACAAACAERDVAAVGERFGGRACWLDLTGGFDSRLLALLGADADVPFQTNTVGPPDSEDVAIAAEIAAATGWRWTRIGLPSDWKERLPEAIDSAVAWSDCHLDATIIAEVNAAHGAKRPAGEVLLNGGGGEHLRDYPWGHELWRANRSRRVDFDRLIAWRVLGPLDLGVFREDPTAAVVDAARQELESRVAQFADTPNTFQDDLLYAFKATGHFGAFQAAAGAEMRVELPFYDPAVFATAISAAPRHRSFHRLMREMIHRLDPAVAALRTETGGPAEPLRRDNLVAFSPYVTRRAARFAGRLRGRLWGGGAGGGPPTPAIAARGALVSGLREQGRLDPTRMRSAALYDARRLEELLTRAAAAPETVDWGALGRIVTVELALQAVDAGIE
jgi:asparagine synthetase B (glutamine-hydrolysing)